MQQDSVTYQSVFYRHTHLYKKLQRIVIVSLLLASIVIVLQGAEPYSTLGALLLTYASTLPLLLWLSTPLRGIPIFPIFALPFVASYAIPLIIDHPVVIQFSPWQHFTAALYISTFLLLTTLVWWLFLQIKNRPPVSYYCFQEQTFVPLFTTVVFLALVYHIFVFSGWIGFGYSLQAITNIVVEVSSSLAAFILGFMWGQGRLTFKQKAFFLVILLLTCFLQSMSLVLLAPVTKLVIVATAVVFGGKRLNYLFLVLLIPLFILLHFGKYEMRAKYWGEEAPRISLFQVPFVVAEWYGHSVAYLTTSEQDHGLELEQVPEEVGRRRFFERLSLMHMFLEVKKFAGHEVPYLNGQTYVVLFEALLPRVLYPAKVSSHHSMHLLSMTYGHQTLEDTYSTHIAWGMVAEAWANFGLPGLFYLSVLLGIGFGLVHVYTRYLPLLSFRGCAGALLCASAIQAHSTTLAIFLVSVFHSFVVLLLIAYVFMKPVTRRNIES